MSAYANKKHDRLQREARVQELEQKVSKLRAVRGSFKERLSKEYTELCNEINNLDTSIATQQRIIQNLLNNKPSHGRPETESAGPKDYYSFF